ncbi:MAG: DUF4340 domain-containing protein [Peptococcaceae bacterium]|nr:DUF4340 domain-containing protein [Peptococcaceae bacterium]
MKRAKRLYILVGILVVLALAVVGSVKYQAHNEEIAATNETILTINPDDVTSLSWTVDDTTLALYKDDGWQYDEDAAFPVDADKVESLLSYFDGLTAAFEITDVENEADYGLDAPSCTIEIATDDDTYTIKLGDYSTMDSQRYVSIGDGNVYLVDTDPMEGYDCSLGDLLARDDVPTISEASSLSFIGDEDVSITYEAYSDDSTDTYNSEDVYFVQEDDDKLPLDTARVQSYLNVIAELSLDDYVTYKATDDDLATYGLDDPVLSAEISYSEDDETKTFAYSIGQTTAENDDGEEETTSYLRIGDSSIIYKLSADSADALLAAGADDFRHQEIFSGDFADVTEIQASVDGENYTLTSEEADDARTFSYDDEEIDTSDLQSALEALSVTEFTDEDASGEEELALTLRLDKEGVPEVTMTFYRIDGESCLAVIDGKTVGHVSRAAVIDLAEALRAIVL